MATERNTGIRGSQIKNLTIKPEDLKRTGDAPTDGQIASFDVSSGDFEWGDAGAGDMLKEVYDTDDDGIIELAKELSDADKDTKIQVEESADEDIIRMDVAGTQEAQLDANGLSLKTGASINEFSTDGTLAGNSDDVAPTEKAVKTYVDANGGGGDVTSDSNITEHSVVRGADGAKGVELSTVFISDAGEMTNASQPSFNVYTSSALTNMPVTTVHTVPFGTERYDQGNNYNTSTYTFTAPVNGKYHFSTRIQIDQIDIDADFYRVIIVTSNKGYEFYFSPEFTGDPVYWEIAGSITTEMEANDTCYITIQQIGGVAQADIPAIHCYFSGYLVH